MLDQFLMGFIAPSIYICRLMNCQKLSLEASTHAAQNERLPLRVIVQVLFFEQLHLRTSISSWFFVSDNLNSSRNPDSALDLSNHNGGRQRGVSHGRGSSLNDVKERVSELEKECESMRERFQKLVKTKRSWNIFCRRKSHQCNNMTSKHSDTKPQPPFATGHGQH